MSRAPRERGAALLILLTILVLAASTLLLSRLQAAAQQRSVREQKSAEALARARRALIAWAVTHPTVPGLLPFPDRNTDPAAYDGRADCVSPTSLNASQLLGRFPEAGEVSSGPCPDWPMGISVRDGSGEPLWYAVSGNLVLTHPAVPINVGLLDRPAASLPFPWLTVVDGSGRVLSDRVAAVIIAPGPALAGQDRDGSAPSAAQYLDSVTIGGHVYDNADGSGVFVSAPASNTFDDQLVYITVDQLMRAVEKRVIGEVASSLASYQRAYGFYPWLTRADQPLAAGAAVAGPGGQAGPGSDATDLYDPNTDFIAAGVGVGEPVRNLDQRTEGTVAAVDTHHLVLNGVGFAPGELYTLERLGGAWGVRAGRVPYAEAAKPDASATGFVVTWPGIDIKYVQVYAVDNVLTSLGLTAASDAQSTEQNALVALQSTLSGPRTVSVAYPPAADGACLWSAAPGVHCYARSAPAPAGYSIGVCLGTCTALTAVQVPVSRYRVVDVTSTGTPAAGALAGLESESIPLANVVATATKVTGVTYYDTVTIGAPLLASPVTVTIGTLQVQSTKFGVADAYHDPQPGVDLPQWFADQQWYRYVYAAYSAAGTWSATAIPARASACVPGGNPACLRLEVAQASGPASTRGDVPALVIGAGAALSAQDRAGRGDLADFYEGENALPGDDLFASGPPGAGFDDQVRVLPGPS